MLDLQVKSQYGCRPRIPSQTDIYRNMKVIYGTIPDYSTPTEVGIEVELEQIKNPAPIHLWQAIKDGSLKDAGMEYVSIPVKDQNLVYAIEDMGNVYKANPDCVFSHRCSIHVHINVSRLTVGQLRALIATYLVVEGLFFKLVDPIREGNSYCYPMADMCLTWERLTPGNLSDQFKYCALNPHHLRDFGTLEFRHHGGTKDKTELLNWVETILQLYRFVEKYNPFEIETSINNLNTVSHYSDFCKDVFEKKFSQFNDVVLYKYLRNNVTAAKVFIG